MNNEIRKLNESMFSLTVSANLCEFFILALIQTMDDAEIQATKDLLPKYLDMIKSNGVGAEVRNEVHRKAEALLKSDVGWCPVPKNN